VVIQEEAWMNDEKPCSWWVEVVKADYMALKVISMYHWSSMHHRTISSMARD
jgi:hypothetical protein